MRSVFQWNLGTRTLELGKRTLIMGILNVTPDSFSDAGEHFESQKAISHGLHLLDQGADIIDIGGESTRPGAKVTIDASSSTNLKMPSKGENSAKVSQPAVSLEEELRRILPVITEIKKHKPQAIISVDTYKAAVARAAILAGAEIVNDVSGLRWDPQMAPAVAEMKCGLILMHMRGRPEEWHSLPPPGDVVLLVKRELRDWAESAVLKGVRRERICLDPGFGFGKSFEQNYPLLSRFQEIQALGFPLLVGTSRKSFLGRMLAKSGKDAAIADRLFADIAVQTMLVFKGAHILRTHSVKAAAEAARAVDTILSSH